MARRVVALRCAEVDGLVDEMCRRLGAEVRARRVALGVSAWTMAKFAKVSDQTILNLEQGRATPLFTTLVRIACCLGVALEELICAAARRARQPNSFG